MLSDKPFCNRPFVLLLFPGLAKWALKPVAAGSAVILRRGQCRTQFLQCSVVFFDNLFVQLVSTGPSKFSLTICGEKILKLFSGLSESQSAIVMHNSRW